MKHTNKIGILAALGITMSIACIVARSDLASASGASYGSHVHGWSHAHPHHAYNSDTAAWWNGTEFDEEHEHATHEYDDDENCTCTTQDDESEDTNADQKSDPQDETNPSSGDVGADTTDYTASCHQHDGGSTNEDSDDTSEDPQTPSTDPSQGGNTGGDTNQNNGGTPPSNDGSATPGGNGNTSGQGSDDGSSSPGNGDQTPPTPPATLDLAVDQQVSVAGGAFKPADTSDDAAAAKVGDDVVWKIVVSPVTVPVGESRTIKVDWTPPANVEVANSAADKGTFDGSVWTLPISTLPAELTVHTKLTKAGDSDAIAAIGKISCVADGADAFCNFEDTNTQNNSNPSVVTTNPASSGGATMGAQTGGQGGEGVGVLGVSTTRAAAQPGGRVLAASTGSLATTGSNTYILVLAGTLLIGSPLAIAAMKIKEQ